MKKDSFSKCNFRSDVISCPQFISGKSLRKTGKSHQWQLSNN